MAGLVVVIMLSLIGAYIDWATNREVRQLQAKAKELEAEVERLWQKWPGIPESEE